MAGERTYPILPCRELDESLTFYGWLGFATTYKQLRPNPSAVVALEDIHIHLFGMEGFVPENSYGSAIIVVPDPEGLYRAFAAGLRQALGKLPVAGIPRLLRPRKKYRTVTGFTVVDPGGNWLRFYRLGDAEPGPDAERATGLAQTILVAARLGDAKGDEAQALKTLESGLARYAATAGARELAQAHLYRAELAVRTHDLALARASLAAARALTLTDEDRAALADDFAQTGDLVEGA